MPSLIVQRVKGRLQHLLRYRGGIEWRRNFRLTTVGDANAEVVDEYVAKQLDHHPMTNSACKKTLSDAAWYDPHVNISAPITSSHGQYVLGLHGVLVHAERWRNTNPIFVDRTRNAALASIQELRCQVSRMSLLADHMHFSIRFWYDISPAEVMLLVMNRVRESHDGIRIWMDGFYVGSLGPYDMNAVRIRSV